MGYEERFLYPLINWSNSFPSHDSGGFPGQGYKHRHNGRGDMHPKALRPKPRNRRGRHRI